MDTRRRSGKRVLAMTALAFWLLRYPIFMVIGGVVGNALGHETLGVFTGLVVCRVAQGLLAARLRAMDEP